MEQEKLYELKRKLYQWAKRNLQGTSVINFATGNLIEISSQGIDEWFSKSKTENQIKSITALHKILQTAIFTHASINIHSERKNAPSFEYYECPFEIEEKNYNVVLSIKIIIEKNKNRRIYYHHYLDEIKKPPSTLVR